MRAPPLSLMSTNGHFMSIAISMMRQIFWE